MAEKDLYKVLGVDRKATAKDIKKAYRKLATKYHPDKNNGDKESEKRFKAISAAYDVLGNPEKRKQYDEFGPSWEYFAQNGGQGAGGPRHDHRESSPGGSAADGWQQFHWQSGGDQGNLDEILKNIFGGGFQQGGGRFRSRENPFGGMNFENRQDIPYRGADLEAALEITLEEAFEGTRTQIVLEGQAINVEIPAGAYTGQKLRLAGKGAPGQGGGQRGDLYLNLRVAGHPLYRLEGLDLHLDLPVTPAEAVLGTEVTVPTLKGNVALKVPAGSNSGKVLRLKNLGMRDRKGNLGNLLVHLKILLPDVLSSREKELYAELSKIGSQDVRQKAFVNARPKKRGKTRAA